jgi:tight adherence protein C
MMLTIIALVVFLAVGAAVAAFGIAVLAPNSGLSARLRVVTGRQERAETAPLAQRVEQSVLDPLSRMLPKSPAEVSRTRQWLIQAGYRESRHLTAFFGIRVLAALTGLAVGLVLGLRSPLTLIAWPALGYLLPRFVLKAMIKARQQRIRLGLPDALDLAVICVEAGLGLEQAILRVGKDLRFSHPDLSDEFNLMNLELRAGHPRAQALRNLATRTGVDDMQALVAVLIQTDRFGTSVAQALRVHSDALRVERRQRAEESAAKTTIKMIPVLIFFVLPALFFVTLGPAAITLYRQLLPVAQQR